MPSEIPAPNLTPEQLATYRAAEAILEECHEKLKALGKTPPYIFVLGCDVGQFHACTNGLTDVSNLRYMAACVETVLKDHLRQSITRRANN